MRTLIKQQLYLAFGAICLVFSWVGTGDLFFLAFCALVPLLYFADKAQRFKTLFWHSYGYFLIFNLGTTWWIYVASPGGVFGAVLLNSLFMALCFALPYWFLRGKSFRFFAMLSVWVSWEYLHQHWDLSFTWLNLGHVFASQVNWVQFYSYTGILAGSIWVWLVNQNLLKFLQNKTLRHALYVLLTILLPLSISYAVKPKLENYMQGKPVQVAILQPNIDPYNEKFSAYGQDLLLEALQKNILVWQDADYLLLPETALVDYQGIWEDRLVSTRAVQEVLAQTSVNAHLRIISGMDSQSVVRGIDTLQRGTRKERGFYYQAHNAAFWHLHGEPFQVYHKSKLVVGVELFPFEPILYPWFSNFLADLGGTTGTLAGQTQQTPFIDKTLRTKVAPIICYESLYGEFVGNFVKNGANWIALITNDAWWGDTPGYKQHLSLARLRAIETRKWIARSANTGISAFIDPLGGVHQATAYNTQTAIVQNIYPNTEQTFYSQYGDFLGRISLFCVFLICLYAFRTLTLPKKYIVS
jgi:apolipoprotein N-acyltransferase